MVTPGLATFARRLLVAARRDVAGLAAAVRPGVPPRPGLYAYRLHPPGGSRRIHLRIHADGSGVLLVDVTDAVHLNRTAAELAWLALEGTPPERAAAVLRRRYRGVDPAPSDRETRAVYAIVEHLSTAAGGCPTCGLAGAAWRPLFSTAVRAPYRADLALTYGCNNACGHCYNERARRAMASLDQDGWRRVLDTLAAAGVPHAIFTGGEPTLFGGLIELIRYADRLGLVVGVNTNGRRMADGAYARSLAQAGASHVQVTLESCRPEIHDAMTGSESFAETVRGVRNALGAGLHTITNTTLTRQNAGHAEEIVDFLHGLGVRTFAANGMIYAGLGRACPDALADAELAPVLVRLRDRAAELAMRFLWYTPTAWCRLSPVELELGPRRCSAGEYSICVEPNGDVLPCQSYYRAAGNLLRDPWPAIWESDLFHGFRNRLGDPRASGLPPECWECLDLAVCGGGCRIQRDSMTGGGGPPEL
jgi:radical SAM protein with 4Fe4S-binding SPASM domain